MPVNRSSTFPPFTVAIDGETVRLRFRRQSVEEFEVFNAWFIAFSEGRGQPTPPETSESAQAWIARKEDEDLYLREHARRIVEVLARDVTVEPGDFLVDGQPITDGAALAQALSGESDLLVEIVRQLWIENRLSEAQKKTLRSQLAFATGSNPAPLEAADGERPAAAAPPAARSVTAARASVRARRRAASSGTTAPTASSASVPSGS